MKQAHRRVPDQHGAAAGRLCLQRGRFVSIHAWCAFLTKRLEADDHITELITTSFCFCCSCRYGGMEKKTAQQVLRSVHGTALAIATARTDLTVADQEALYKKVFFGLLEDTIGSMNTGELLDVLAM